MITLAFINVTVAPSLAKAVDLMEQVLLNNECIVAERLGDKRALLHASYEAVWEKINKLAAGQSYMGMQAFIGKAFELAGARERARKAHAQAKWEQRRRDVDALAQSVIEGRQLIAA